MSPYVIYRGDCATGCYGGSTSDYWTVDNYNGDSAFSCANLPARVGTMVMQNWRTTQTNTLQYETGNVESIVNGCQMKTSIYTHCTQYDKWKDSGSGLVKTSGEVIGIATRSTGVCSGLLIFSSFYEGLLDIQFYYNNTFLCTLSGGSGCT